MDNEQKLLVSRRQGIFASVQRTYDAFADLQPANVYSVKDRFERLSLLESKFQSVQSDIEKSNAKLTATATPIEVNQVQSSFEAILYGAEAFYRTAEKLGQNNSVSAPLAESTPVKSVITLPVIDLPKFCGDISKWTEFYSLFKSLIDDNDTLRNVQKLHYLKCSLSEQPLAVISEFQICDESYPLALKALISRYENKRLLGSLYVQRILEFVPLKSTSHEGHQSFLKVHRNAVEALKALNIPELGDFLLLCLSLANLDPSSRRAFENKQASHVTPHYKSLIDFLEEQCRTMELCAVGKTSNSSTKSSSSMKKVNSFLLATAPVSDASSKRSHNKSSRSSSNSNIMPLSCPVCKSTHTLYQCNVFRGQSVEERYDTLRQLKRCFNCMGAHMRSQCSSKGSCSVCRSNKHHSMLHSVSSPPACVEEITPLTSCSKQSPQTLSCHVRASNLVHQTVLLGTVRAFIHDAQGNWQPVRAVIDSGSQISAITNSLVQKLGLKVKPIQSELSGVGRISTRVYGTVQCSIASRHSSATFSNINAYVLTAIAGNLPTCSIPVDAIERYRSLTLADDRFYVPSAVDFLIGADIYTDILCTAGDSVIGCKPAALNTVFGWVVIGPVNSVRPSSEPSYSLLTVANPPLDSTLRLFWESEEVSRPTPLDPLDKLVEEHFITTHSRDISGRYSVALPFNPDCKMPGSNRHAALQNFLSLERRLKRDTPTYDSYHQFMSDYALSLHMQPAVKASDYIIPHHCVSKVTSSTTKLRVVFNASSPDKSGVSLNQALMCGPKLQGDLPGILTTFRGHTIALCADVRQMYRQILVHSVDRAYQHIFWRPELSSPVVEFELNTITYGLTPSAFLAQRVLQQLVTDDGAKFPLASLALTSHTYIDDIVSGANDINEARELLSQLQSLTRRACVELRKWASNVPEVLNSLPEEHLEIPLVFSNDDQGLKILGLLWDPRSDCFSFHTLPFNGCITKRTVLSYIARIFDPLGFITPFVCWMKVYIQQLWLSRVQWDDALPESLSQRWLAAVNDVSHLSGFRIPRLIARSNAIYRLVGFCDASEKAYAAALYLHAETGSNSNVSLLRARSKVAPIKPLTVPKLELLGALLLSRLLKAILPAVNRFRIEAVALFTDSTIVLAWLRIPPYQLKTFVANRVVEILEDTSPTDWAHVRSEENPADCASRGLLPLELLKHPLWLNGSPFMCASPSTWPCSVPSVDSILELPELKPSTVVLITLDPVKDPLLAKLENFSSLLKAKRVFGHVVRFASILLARRARLPSPKGPLLPSELSSAMNMFVRLTQAHYYASELRQLAKSAQLSPRISALKPFVDPRGFLRVGGRLNYSVLPEEARHPLLLPKDAHLSSLLCDSFHMTSLHSGPRTVQALIQQHYWIMSLRGLLRQRIRHCLTCYKFRAKPLQPVMADLPAPRAQPSRAFLHVGTDYAGPFSVKTSNRRNAPVTKGYLCLFICMATKAVHLETVSDLSSEAFLACLDRFLARRGLPAHMYSDCGRNYVGAARTLREIHTFLAQHDTSISDALTHRGVQWHFNPPLAPNFGGLWEAGVKSAKLLLHRLVKDTPHTFEEYATLFAQIEAVLNSRPLCATSFDPFEGPDYLSPGHFLIGTSLLARPEHTMPDNVSHLSRWHRVRQLHQAFWARWSTEYLHTQMQRGKWVRACPNLKIGDVVFVLEPSCTPLSWPIGRVVQICSGMDKVVRVVSVRTAKGVFTRPVNKLVTLPPP